MIPLIIAGITAITTTIEATIPVSAIIAGSSALGAGIGKAVYDNRKKKKGAK